MCAVCGQNVEYIAKKTHQPLTNRRRTVTAQIARPLRGEKQIQSSCKLCCRYVENTVEMSVQIKTLKILKSSLITALNFLC